MQRLAMLFALITLLLGATAATAHESRPVYVEITEHEGQVFQVMWKVPVTVAAYASPEVVMPDTCEAMAAGGGARKRLYHCADDLSGASVGIDFGGINPSVSTLMHLSRLNGETHSAILSPEQTEWRIPEKERTLDVIQEYMRLGVAHILGGYDHLLFVACLMLIAGSPRRILLTVTGFTLAHSVTLALAALGVVRVALPPVEAAIALSIVFLAMELARGRRDTLTWRFPFAVSVSFGLLHGFGFASVLHEIGLPQTEIPAALLFFNLGVEIGQILFVLALVGVYRIVQGVGPWVYRGARGFLNDPTRLHRPAGYVVGVLASFWMIERLASFWA